MSVQSAATFARWDRVSKAEQQVRQANSTLSGFRVSDGVGAGVESLTVAERLLVAALATIRAVRDELPAGGDDPDADPDGGVGAVTPPPAPVSPATQVFCTGGAVTPSAVTVVSLGSGNGAATPLTVRSSMRGLDVVR